MTTSAIAILFRLWLAATPAHRWEATKAWYASLSLHDSQSCASLTVLAREGCSVEGYAPSCVREYTPRSCGGIR